MALVGCVSNTVEKRKDLCNFSSLDELTGSYVNLGNGKLNGRDLYLSEILWSLSKSNFEFSDVEINSVTIKYSDNELLATAKSIDGRLSTINFTEITKFGDKVINLFDDTDFLPAPSGGVVVGPQNIQINFNKDCNGNLLVHKSEKVTGLIFLLIPVKSELNEYISFKRI